jgi:hypothetical protein
MRKYTPGGIEGALIDREIRHLTYHRYSPEEKRFIEDNASGLSYAELQELFNKRFGISLTISNLRRYMFNHSLREKKKRKYTQKEIRFIIDNISGRNYEEMTEMFNRKFKAPITKKNLAYILECHNISHYINHRLVGSEKIQESKGYTLVKVAEPNIWKEKHRLIWEAANGPIPEGHAILFADGNKSNFDLKNLLLVSHRERMVMNRKHLIFPNAEATKAGLLMAKIILQTKDYERRGKEGGGK